jgi:hypothetical protein
MENEIPEVRAFFAPRHAIWPYAFFCNFSAADDFQQKRVVLGDWPRLGPVGIDRERFSAFLAF